MVEVEGEYLVWAKDPSESCNHYHMIGLNVNYDHAIEIAEETAEKYYPGDWERQDRNIFLKNQPGSPYAVIMITSFNDQGR